MWQKLTARFLCITLSGRQLLYISPMVPFAWTLASPSVWALLPGSMGMWLTQELTFFALQVWALSQNGSMTTCFSRFVLSIWQATTWSGPPHIAFWPIPANKNLGGDYGTKGNHAVMVPLTFMLRTVTSHCETYPPTPLAQILTQNSLLRSQILTMSPPLLEFLGSCRKTPPSPHAPYIWGLVGHPHLHSGTIGSKESEVCGMHH